MNTIKNPHAVALGKLGGFKGGKARAAKLSSKQRSEIAKDAAKKRWQRVEEENKRFITLKILDIEKSRILNEIDKLNKRLKELRELQANSSK